MNDLFGNLIDSIDVRRDIDQSLKPCTFRQWQLREGDRIYNYGVSALSNEELMAHILRDKPAAGRLLDHFGTLDNIADAHIHELTQIDGIGRAKAEKLKVAFELSKRMNNSSMTDKPSMDSPKKVFNYISDEYKNLKQEVLKVFILNAKSHLITSETVYVGTLESSVCHPREIYRTAIKLSAAGIIITHNHPSGNPQPSKDDIHVSKQIMEAGQIVGIKLVDHVIIGDDEFYSMKEEGII